MKPERAVSECAKFAESSWRIKMGPQSPLISDAVHDSAFASGSGLIALAAARSADRRSILRNEANKSLVINETAVKRT